MDFMNLFNTILGLFTNQDTMWAAIIISAILGVVLVLMILFLCLFISKAKKVNDAVSHEIHAVRESEALKVELQGVRDTLSLNRTELEKTKDELAIALIDNHKNAEGVKTLKAALAESDAELSAVRRNNMSKLMKSKAETRKVTKELNELKSYMGSKEHLGLYTKEALTDLAKNKGTDLKNVTTKEEIINMIILDDCKPIPVEEKPVAKKAAKKTEKVK